MKKFRILGYYHFSNQDMKPEEERIQEAIDLAPLLAKSLQSIYQNPETDKVIRDMISSPTVFIFKDEENQLYGFFTKNKTVRLSHVKFNKSAIVQVSLKYKAWFYPGQSISLIRVDENIVNNNQIILHRILIWERKQQFLHQRSIQKHVKESLTRCTSLMLKSD